MGGLVCLVICSVPSHLVRCGLGVLSGLGSCISGILWDAYHMGNEPLHVTLARGSLRKESLKSIPEEVHCFEGKHSNAENSWSDSSSRMVWELEHKQRFESCRARAASDTELVANEAVLFVQPLNRTHGAIREQERRHNVLNPELDRGMPASSSVLMGQGD